MLNSYLFTPTEGKGPEIMKLLVPAGMEAPLLWDQNNKSEGNMHATRRLRDSISPVLFSLTNSCCVMLTNPYPVQVRTSVFLTHHVENIMYSFRTMKIIIDTLGMIRYIIHQ